MYLPEPVDIYQENITVSTPVITDAISKFQRLTKTKLKPITSCLIRRDKSGRKLGGAPGPAFDMDPSFVLRQVGNQTDK